MGEFTTRNVVRFNADKGGRLIDRIIGQSTISAGSVVLLSDGNKYSVTAISNPHGVEYSVAYVTPYPAPTALSEAEKASRLRFTASQEFGALVKEWINRYDERLTDHEIMLIIQAKLSPLITGVLRDMVKAERAE